MNILMGLGMVIAGFLIVWKSEWIYENIGTVEWAEAHMQSMGGSRLFYKFIGICLIVAGFLTATGLMGDLGRTILPRFFSGVTLQ